MLANNGLQIRPIEKKDNEAIFQVIRCVFEELDIVQPGTAYFDECLPKLYETYTTERGAYFVALENGEIIGGAGIFPTEDLPANTVELVKMYLLDKARGKGYGQLLMNACLEAAKNKGYINVYLETLPELEAAQQLYLKNGFRLIESVIGNSGHFACSVRMLKQLI
jgi:putative acetyltransferase